MKLRTVAAAAAAAILSLAPVLTLGGSAEASASHALIQGSGSSWSANAVNQWVADVKAEGLQVVFTPNGDAAGRQDFANRVSDFAVTSLGYQGRDPVTGVDDTSQGRPYAYLPIVAGGTAFPYQIRYQGQQVKNLRLSGTTLVKIFTGQITSWSDPAITKDNDGHKLPPIPIIPVVQSEGSGSTYQLTRYFSKVFPSIWSKGATEYFPQGMSPHQVAQNGSDAAMNYVSSASANGAIGYVEYSYALGQNYPVAKLLNRAGYYTLPTQYNVAVALEKAQINMDKSSPDYLLQNLDGVYTDSDPRTYPLSSYSYQIVPTGKYPNPESKITTAKRQTIADFDYYSICQGQKEVGPIGYSPLPVNLVEAGFGQLRRLKAADPGVDLTERNVSTCHNPTFIAGHPNTNYLAKIAPMPPACDKVGRTPCAAGVTPDGTGKTPTTSGHNLSGTPGGGSTAGAGSTGPSGTAGTAGSGTTVGGGATAGSSGTGPLTGTSAAAGPLTGATGGTAQSGAAVDAPLTVSADLAGYRSGNAGRWLGPVVGALLVAAVILPPLLVRRHRRRNPVP